MIEDKFEILILECGQLEPERLANSSQIRELENLISKVEPEDCDQVAEVFYQLCTGFENHNPKIDLFQKVLLLSLVEKMNFPDPKGAEGFHYWADKCSCELIDIGSFFFTQEEPEELDLALSLVYSGMVSDFAQTYLVQSLYEISDDEMKKLLSLNQSHLVWLGAFANVNFTSRENIQWLVENFPNLELLDLVKMIEQYPVSYAHWEYPFRYFSREERVTDSVIVYLIEILQEGYIFRNEKERTLASALLDWEDEYDEFDKFLSLAEEACGTDDVLRMARSSLLASLVEAAKDEQ